MNYRKNLGSTDAFPVNQLNYSDTSGNQESVVDCLGNR